MVLNSDAVVPVKKRLNTEVILLDVKEIYAKRFSKVLNQNHKGFYCKAFINNH